MVATGCGCGAQWAGGKAAHCSLCHLTLATVEAFDAHVCLAKPRVRRRGLTAKRSAELIEDRYGDVLRELGRR